MLYKLKFAFWNNGKYYPPGVHDFPEGVTLPKTAEPVAEPEPEKVAAKTEPKALSELKTSDTAREKEAKK